MKSPFVLIMLVAAFSAFSQDSGNDHYETKVAELNGKIAQEPSNPALYFARGDAYDMLNDFEQSNRDYLKTINLYLGKPDSRYASEFAKACYRLADEYYFRKANTPKAITYLEEGMKAFPGDKDMAVLDAIITGRDSTGRELAAAKYSALVQKYPDDIRLNLYYGDFLKDTDFIAAAERYEKALQLDPINKEALLWAGTLYNNEAARLSGGDNDPAVAYDHAQRATSYFERLHKMNPNDKEITNILVRLYEELAQQDKAAALKKAPY